MSEIPKDWMPLFQWRNEHYEQQREFVDSFSNFWETLFVAGNGTGKTHILYWSGICLALGIHPYQEAVGDPPLRIKVLINDFEHGLDKIFKETCMMDQHLPDGRVIKRMLPHSAVKNYWSRDNRVVNYLNGSYMFFQTDEQKKKLHSGTNFDILLCDEEPAEQQYDESKRGLRTAKGGGRILHSFTPPFDEESKNRGPTWTKFKLVDPWERGESDDLHVVRACMKDNPAITDEFIKRFSKGKTEEQIRIQVYGDYPTWGKLIFPDFVDRLWNPDEKTGNLLPYNIDVPWEDPDVKFEMALDWHGSKPPAVIWTFEYLTGPNKGDVVVFDEISPLEGKDWTISGTSQAIREHEGWRRVKIIRYGDPKMRDKNNALISGFSPWDEFRHCGIRLSPGWNREPYVGYSIINDFIRGKGKQNLGHPRLFIRENCRTLIYNMKNHFNVAKKDGTASPDPKFSDYCVSLKYIMQKKSRKIKKNMDRKRSAWPLTSHNNEPLGPYGGHYVTDFR